ncbi:unnamed protein product, partial [Meganyctiphanes norvegica]
MAEFVEKRIEETVPEVEEMERMGLLAPKEIKKLIIKRKEYEYRIARRTKSKMDFINYVEYEKKLLELLKIRRKKVNCYEKKSKIEGCIARRTIKQLRHMTRIWHGDLDVWAMRVEFAKYRHWKEEVSVAYTEQLRFHSHLEWLWVALARWEVEGRKNFDRARRVLLSMAPLYHPKSITIRREVFRLELLYLESLRFKMENDNIAGLEELNNENKEKVLECGVARIVYQDSIEQIPLPELYLQFYRVAHNFDFAHTLRDEIYRDLCAAFLKDDSVWKLRAQRAALGLPEQLEALEVKAEETPNDDEDDESEEESEENKKENNKDELVKESTDNVRNKETKDDDIDEEDEENAENESDEDSSDEEDLQKQNITAVSSSEEESDNEVEEGDTMEESEDEEDDAKENSEGEEEVKQDDSDEGYDEDIAVLDEASANTPKTAPQKTLETIFSTFGTAMQMTNGEFANSYVTELLPLLYQCWGIDQLRNMIFKKINTIYNENTNKLSPLNYFVVWSVLSAQDGSLEDQRRVLESGLNQHPGHKQMQLQLLQIVAKDAYTDQEFKKVFDSVRKSLSGQWLVSAWDIATNSLTNAEVLTQLFDEAHKSHNIKVSKAMRTRHLQWKYQKAGIVGCRKLYRNVQGMPPFSAAAHSTMLQLELQQKNVSIDEVRRVLDNAVRQFGETHPGVWLSYIYFEKNKGDPVKVNGLYTRAEKTLNAEAAHTFRAINMAIRETLNKNSETETKKEDEEDNESTVVVVGTETELSSLNSSTSHQEEEQEERRLNAAALVNVVAEEVIMGHSQHRERAAFFNNLLRIRERLVTDSEDPTEAEESVWESPLKSLVGNKVSLVLKKVKVSKKQQIKDDPSRKVKKGSDMITPRFTKSYELSDQLQVEGEEETLASTESSLDINKILKESETLHPSFMNRRRVKPYAVSKKKAKAIRKRQREKTAGSGWNNMKAPEITPEVQRDLEILQMRGVLNPKRHYKNSDMKVLPKFFQMGTVIDNPLDFYTNRVTKKDRKKTLAEEIIHDEEVLRYQKRKYNEIIVNKQKKEFKHRFHGKKGNKGGKNNSGDKPAKKRKVTS